MEKLSDRNDRAGSFRWSLDDHCASSANRGSDLSNCLVERKVPWSKRNAHADWLAEHHLANAIRPRRNHATVDSATFLRMPLRMLGADRNLSNALSERLALVELNAMTDLLRTRASSATLRSTLLRSIGDDLRQDSKAR